MDKNIPFDLSAAIKSLAGNWAAYSLLGSFALYVAGYLSLRFYLTVLGIGTDLTVLDERYVFIGIKFLVYSVSTIPILVLLGILVYFPLKLIFFISSKYIKIPIKNKFFTSNVAIWIGIIFSVIFIQFVMRQCFTLSNLLVSDQAPSSVWLTALLTKQAPWEAFYFPILFAGTFFVSAIWWSLKDVAASTLKEFWLKNLLALLCIIQILLLPINYGTLILDQSAPRVTKPKIWADEKYKNLQVWLVWEGTTGVTYLTRDLSKNNKRTLVTLSKKSINYKEILCYDMLMPVIFEEEKSCTK